MRFHSVGRVVLISLCGIIFAGNAKALTGNDWRNLPPTSRQAYVVGVLDSIRYFEELRIEVNKLSVAKEFQEPPSIFTNIVICMAGKMTYEQMVAIVEKHIENNPAEWHFDMPALVWRATKEACPPKEGK